MEKGSGLELKCVFNFVCIIKIIKHSSFNFKASFLFLTSFCKISELLGFKTGNPGQATKIKAPIKTIKISIDKET